MTQRKYTQMDALTQAALADIVWTWEQVAKRVVEKGERVYLVDCPQTGATKIGISNNVRRRLRELQGTSSANLFLRFSYPAHGQHEQCVHWALGEARIRGEWFETPAVDRFYAQLESIRAERDRDVSMLEAFHVWRMRHTEAYPGCGYVEPLW